LTGIANMPSLIELDLSENPLRQINELGDLPGLKLLTLKKTKIEKF